MSLDNKKEIESTARPMRVGAQLGTTGMRRLQNLTSNLVGGAAGIDRDNTDENSGNSYYGTEPVREDVDVVVIGAGPAGVAAALSAFESEQ